MLFTITFLNVLYVAIVMAMPLLSFMGVVVMLLGLLAGRIEKWPRFDSVYWAFVTATTVGYGDIRPVKKSTRAIAIVIAFTGIIFTGIVVSLAVQATTYSFNKHHTIEELKAAIEKAEE